MLDIKFLVVSKVVSVKTKNKCRSRSLQQKKTKDYICKRHNP